MDATVATATSRLTSGRLLARNAMWNLGASVASITIALFTVPILLKYLGTDRFGVVSLVWIVEGQFGIFDLGLGSALTKLVAEKLGSSREEEIPSIFWTSLLIMGIFGLIGSVILRGSASWLVHSALKVPPRIQLETLSSFHLVAISLPIVISTGALRGFLAAHQRFDLLSAVRVPLSIFSYLVPLLVLPFSRSLAPFVLVMVIARFLTWAVHLILCFRVSRMLRHKITIQGAPLRRMLTFGGWMTVTNIVSPIMVNIDRLVIGSMISMAAVAYYAAPYNVATQLFVIPSAITAVLFPAFATALVQDRRRAALLFERAVKYIFLSLFPAVLSALALGQLGLHIWLGSAFAQQSTTVLRCLVLGVFANSLAQVPFWQIQAAGRPDWAAKMHLVELPCYLFVFWGLTRAYGIDGAGLAWLLRTTIDAAVVFLLSSRLLPESKPAVRHLLLLCTLASPLFLAAILVKGNAVALIFLVVVCLGFLAVTWFWLLTPQERELARNPIRALILKQRVASASAESS